MRIRTYKPKLQERAMIAQRLRACVYNPTGVRRKIDFFPNKTSDTDRLSDTEIANLESLQEWTALMCKKKLLYNCVSYPQGLYLLQTNSRDWLVIPKDEQNLLGVCTGVVSNYIEWIELSKFDYKDSVFSSGDFLSKLVEEGLKRFSKPKELPEFQIRRASATANRADKSQEELKEWDRIAEVIRAEKAKLA